MAAETLDVSSMLPAKFEPKRKNRWVLMIEGIDAYIIKTTARPTITTEEVEVPFINSRRYLAGKTTFGTQWPSHSTTQSLLPAHNKSWNGSELTSSQSADAAATQTSTSATSN